MYNFISYDIYFQPKDREFESMLEPEKGLNLRERREDEIGKQLFRISTLEILWLASPMGWFGLGGPWTRHHPLTLSICIFTPKSSFPFSLLSSPFSLYRFNGGQRPHILSPHLLTSSSHSFSHSTVVFRSEFFVVAICSLGYGQDGRKAKDLHR